MSEAPTFTIVIPAYNAASTIGPAIRSVFAQTRDDFQLVVVDDGSRDETAERIRPFEADPRLEVVRQPNRGLAAARNTAIGRARGRLVSMLDSDDLWLPTYLEVMAEALDGDPEAGFAYTDAWLLDDGRRRIQRASAMAYQDPPDPPPAEPRAFLEELIQRNFVFTSATVRRSVLEEVGGYRESLAASEDYELWLRIVARGYRGARAPGLLAVYRKRPGTLSTDEARMFSSMLEVARIVAEEYDVPPAIRDLAHARMTSLNAALSRDGRALSARYRIRALLVRLKRAVLAPWLWHRTPPPEIRAAFPDLAQ
jgi:glycosyltransferase involved in cell wall biosynthesis